MLGAPVPILLVFLSETGLAMFKISLLFMAFWDAALQHGGIRMRFLRPIPTSPAALAADASRCFEMHFLAVPRNLHRRSQIVENVAIRT